MDAISKDHSIRSERLFIEGYMKDLLSADTIVCKKMPTMAIANMMKKWCYDNYLKLTIDNQQYRKFYAYWIANEEK
jgi:hypothetical protein